MKSALVLCILTVIILGFVATTVRSQQEAFSREVKCLVCRITVREMEQRIKKVDPKKRIDVKGFRMDSKETVSVPLVKSEMFLTELMEEICEAMEDYAKARYKDTNELTILKFIDDQGKMNAEISKVDFIQDGDLNKSLKHFCLEVLEDHEEAFLNHYMADVLPDQPEFRICHSEAQYCNAAGNGAFAGNALPSTAATDDNIASERTEL